MSERWVVNASPLIVLSKAGLADLLTDLPDEVFVPQSVADEVEAGPEEDPARKFLASGVGRIIAPMTSERVGEWSLGAGETSVLSAVLELPGAKAVIDDAAARRCAVSLGIPCLETLAILVRARETGRLKDLKDGIELVVQAGLHVSNELIARLLAAVEKNPMPPSS